jgi:dihydropteroate synthase
VVTNFEDYGKQTYKIGKKVFSFDKSYVMGILNVTPDSFSDGGQHFLKEDAINYGIRLLDEGADILDIGGESSRPGASPVGEAEETDRIIPVIKGILAERNNAVISVDTTKPGVAEEALSCGATIINDISGLTMHPELAFVVKKYDAALIIMHIKGNPENMQVNPSYNNLIQEVYDFLFIQSSKALQAGIRNIFIDPGIGFGKTVENNFEIIKRLEDFRSIGFPILIGNSRKSFLGKTLDLVPMERDSASAMMNCVSIRNGARIIRTHNVSFGVQSVKLMNNLR